MRLRSILSLISIVSCSLITWEPARASTPTSVTRAELNEKQRWIQQNLFSARGLLPFSFTYSQTPSKELLPGWQRTAIRTRLDQSRVEQVIIWHDAQSGLEVRCRAVEYLDFPTVEWTLNFKNIGVKETSILSDIHAIDITLRRTSTNEFILHHNAGDNCSAASYEPFQMKLPAPADERLVIMRNLGFFSTAESLVGNNIVLAIFRHVTNPEARQYLLRQAFEEAIHTHTFHYICESLAIDEREVFNMYHEVNSIHQKDAFEMKLTEDIMQPDFTTDTIEGMQRFVKNLVGFYVIMEGIFFYSGFVMMLSFHRQNRMTGVGSRVNWLL
jgi:hypothetical protein